MFLPPNRPLPVAVIFDMDGVLLDSEPLHYRALQQALATAGLDFTEALNPEYLGWSFGPFIADIRARFGLAEADDHYFGLYDQAILPALESATECEGVTPLVRALHERGVKLAVASSSPRKWIEVVLDALHLSSYFSAIAAGDAVKRTKPDPEIYLLAASLLRVPPDRCIAIEDSPHGVLAATRAGIPVIGVRTQLTTGLALPGTDIVVDSLARNGGAWERLGLTPEIASER